jgi:hypothetical protein
VLNLRFDTGDARLLGVDGHVCELQLTTRGFAALAQVENVRRWLVKGEKRRAGATEPWSHGGNEGTRLDGGIIGVYSPRLGPRSVILAQSISYRGIFCLGFFAYVWAISANGLD